jgi:hypothetical protein
MKKLYLLLILVILSPLSWGNQRFQGKCTASGSVLTSGLSSTNSADLTYASATVTVSVVGGGLATIFSDNANTPLSNPFTANSDATFGFYAANGRYSIVCSGIGVPTTTINSDALLDDPQAALTTTNLALSEGTCALAGLGLDVLCADSGTHSFKSSLNNGSFVAIPQIAGDLGGTAASPQVTGLHVAAGGELSGTITGTPNFGTATAQNLNGVLYVGSGTGQYASIAACYSAASAGQTCVVPPGWTETWTSNLALTKSNVMILLMGSGTVTAGSNQITCPGGTSGGGIVGLSPTGAFSVSGFGTSQTITHGGFYFTYTGSGAFINCGSSSNPTTGMRLENFGIDLTGAGPSAIGMDLVDWQVGGWVRGVGMVMSGPSHSQVGIQTDGAGASNTFDISLEDNQLTACGTCFLLNSNTQEVYMAGNQLGTNTLPAAGCNTGLSISGNGNRFVGGNIVGCTTAVSIGGASAGNVVDTTLGASTSGGASAAITFGSSTSNNTVLDQNLSQAPIVTDSGFLNTVSSPGTGKCFDGCVTTILKVGSGLGNYTSSNTTLTNVDATNLGFTVTIPTGWKLIVGSSGSVTNSSTSNLTELALADGGSLLQPQFITPPVASSDTAFSLGPWAITGDGNSHTITLQWRVSAGTGTMANGFTGQVVLTGFLTPSN